MSERRSSASCWASLEGRMSSFGHDCTTWCKFDEGGQGDAEMPTDAPLSVPDVCDIALTTVFARKANSTPSAHFPHVLYRIAPTSDGLRVLYLLATSDDRQKLYETIMPNRPCLTLHCAHFERRIGRRFERKRKRRAKRKRPL